MGSRSRWAMIWSVYASPDDKSPIYKTSGQPPERAAGVGCSVKTAQSPDKTPQTKNCTHDSATPLTRPMTWETVRICAEKAMALKNTKRSPRLIPPPPERDRRKNPPAASPTLIQTGQRAFHPNSSPATGTITIYSTVINPALPAPEWLMPICWSEVARLRNRPHSAPPPSRAFRSVARP